MYARNGADTPLVLAIRTRYLDGVRLLLEGGADVNLVPRPSDLPPLSWAVYSIEFLCVQRGQPRKARQYVDIMEALIAAGADVNYDQSSALAVSSTAHTAKVLLKAGARINLRKMYSQCDSDWDKLLLVAGQCCASSTHPCSMQLLMCTSLGIKTSDSQHHCVVTWWQCWQSSTQTSKSLSNCPLRENWTIVCKKQTS